MTDSQPRRFVRHKNDLEKVLVLVSHSQTREPSRRQVNNSSSWAQPLQLPLVSYASPSHPRRRRQRRRRQRRRGRGRRRPRRRRRRRWRPFIPLSTRIGSPIRVHRVNNSSPCILVFTGYSQINYLSRASHSTDGAIDSLIASK